MAASTRPLTLGEILDRTVQLYRRDFLLFLGISAAPAAVNVLFSGGMGIFVTSRATALQTPANAGPQALLLLGLFAMLFLSVGLPLLLGVFAIAFGALNRTAFQRNRGEATTIREAYTYSFRLFWRHLGIFSLQLLFAAVLPGIAFTAIFVIGAILTAAVSGSSLAKSLALLLGIAAVLLVIAVLVVSVLIWIRFCLAFPASVTEQIKAWPSLKRSNLLSKGTRGRIFIMYLLVAILTMVVYYALTAPIDIVLKLTVYRSITGLALISHPPLAMQVANLLISFLERAFVMPIYAIALLLFYNDQRMRIEGYDIELLMDQAGWSELAQPLTQPSSVAETAPAQIPTEIEPAWPAAEPPRESASETQTELGGGHA